MYLGLDIGTSAVKAVLLSADGRLVAQAQSPLAVSRPQPSWSEQDPEDWWRASIDAVRQLPAASRAKVQAVGLSGQMHGATVLDVQGRVLRPAILWNDGRAFAQCAQLEAREPNSRQITGNIAMPGFTAPKLLWLREHEPEVFRRIEHVLLPKDYVRLRLTGEYLSDLSDSSGTLWLDVGARAWSQRMLSACDLDLRQMPGLVEGSEPAGKLTASAAQQLGVPVVAVAGGGGDNAAGAVGAGVVDAGQALLSLGTSGVIFVANDRFMPNPAGAVHAFCHALPGRWHQMAVLLSAASCVDWVARLGGFPGVPAALAAAQRRSRATPLPLFLPYLSGERTPHNDPYARGVFFGLDHDTDSAALVQSVLEGVALALRDGLRVLSDAGSAISELSVIGGGSRSLDWAQLLASALERTLVIRDAADVGPALGAARLAALAVRGSSIEALCVPPPVVRIVEPDASEVNRLRERSERFRSLYRALRDQFPREVTH
ncbi:MAG: xylulokinase [Steroidobacteraceae bacterium]